MLATLERVVDLRSEQYPLPQARDKAMPVVRDVTPDAYAYAVAITVCTKYGLDWDRLFPIPGVTPARLAILAREFDALAQYVNAMLPYATHHHIYIRQYTRPRIPNLATWNVFNAILENFNAVHSCHAADAPEIYYMHDAMLGWCTQNLRWTHAQIRLEPEYAGGATLAITAPNPRTQTLRELFTDANRMMQACRRLPPAPAVIQHAWDLFLPTVPEAMRAPLRTFAARYPLNPEFLFNTFALVRPPENTRIRDALVVLRDHSHAFLARMRVRPHTVVRNAPPCISSADTIIPVPLTPTDDPGTFTFPLPAELYHIASTAAINDLDDMRTSAHCRAFWPTALRYAPPHAIVLHASTGRVAVPPEVVQTILNDVRALIAALPAN